MYKETLKTKDQATKAHQSQDAIDSKVNRICDTFLTTLEQPQYRNSHLQNIITAHVCKVPADLESGLEMIGKLQGMILLAFTLTANGSYLDRSTRSLDRESGRAHMLPSRRQPTIRYSTRHLQSRTRSSDCATVSKSMLPSV